MPDFKLDDLTPRMTGKGINGVSFPAFIRNGNHFLTDLDVYADGVVDCWDRVDLALFRQKVASGWVQTSIPDGDELSAHDLAHMTPVNATWHMAPHDLVDRVEAIVLALNPARTGLVDIHGSDADGSSLEEYRSTDVTWRCDESEAIPPKLTKGASNQAFWRLDDAVHVVTISLFNDDTIRINGLGTPMFMTLDDLRRDDRLSVATDGDRVSIPGLCVFTATNVDFTVPPMDFIAELEINRDRHAGRTTSMDRTFRAFQAYLDNPTKENLETLREAYESVPEHMRRFCGDMDTKDIPIRIALYGKQEIEKWSHFRVAKLQEEPLPSITVPEPDDT